MKIKNTIDDRTISLLNLPELWAYYQVAEMIRIKTSILS